MLTKDFLSPFFSFLSPPFDSGTIAVEWPLFTVTMPV